MLKPLTKTDFRQLFCDALRSGKYEKVQRGAAGWRGNQVCALGVGVRIGLWTEDEYCMRKPVSSKLGINADDVVSRNDDGPDTFEQIADWIEQQP